MTRAEALLSHAGTILVAATGFAYGWMRYFAEPADEFAVVNHPWQSDTQGLHILFAPLLVFVVGLLWTGHVCARLRSGSPARRKTGVVLLLLFFPMVASGYLLQTTSGETLRDLWVGVHVVTSCLWFVIYVVHLFLRRSPMCDFEDETDVLPL